MEEDEGREGGLTLEKGRFLGAGLAMVMWMLLLLELPV